MVFKDEEDEENWLNWMETSEIENNTQVLSVSPNMQVFPVQPVRDTRSKRKDSKRGEKVVYFYSNNNKLKELSNPSDNEAENGEMSGGYEEENFDLTKDDINPDKEAPEMNGDFCHFTDVSHCFCCLFNLFTWPSRRQGGRRVLNSAPFLFFIFSRCRKSALLRTLIGSRTVCRSRAYDVQKLSLRIWR